MPSAMESTSSASTSAEPGTSTGSASTAVPPSTFGMDAPADEGSEAGFVPPLDLACAGPSDGASRHCALCDVRAQQCLDDFRCVAWAEDGGDALIAAASPRSMFSVVEGAGELAGIAEEAEARLRRAVEGA